MENMNITSAQYYTNSIDGSNVGITAIINGVEMHVPLASGNRHYDEIMRQVAAGTLTIQEAD